MRLIMDNQIIKDNLTYVKEKIDQACQKVGRNPDEVSLLLATKTVSPENINKTIDQGETLIVESKAQELLEKKLNILIQVNTSYEDSKFGVAPEDTLGLIEQLVELDALNIKGLMTIGRLSADPEEARIYFQRLKAIQEQVKAQSYPGVEMDVLSMGMTKDYEIAVEEGATIIRVGTAIFGERMYPDSYY